MCDASRTLSNGVLQDGFQLRLVTTKKKKLDSDASVTLHLVQLAPILPCEIKLVCRDVKCNAVEAVLLTSAVLWRQQPLHVVHPLYFTYTIVWIN